MPASEETTPDTEARVWSQMTVKVNLGNYESVDISMGASRPCRNTDASIKRMHTKIVSELEEFISEKVEEVRELWGNTKEN